MSPAPLRVFLVDDEALVLEGIRLLLEVDPNFEVVGTAAGAEAALQALSSADTDVLVTDLQMEGLDGVALTRLAKMSHPDMPVLVLSSADESLHAADALSAGASGYMMKRSAPDALPAALLDLPTGAVHLSSSMWSRLSPTDVSVEPKTERETALCDALCDVPRPATAVASQLGWTLAEVESCVYDLLHRHGLTDLVQLRLALQKRCE